MDGLDDARVLALVRDKLGVPEPLINQFRRLADKSDRSLEELIIDMGLTSSEQLSSLMLEAASEARSITPLPRPPSPPPAVRPAPTPDSFTTPLPSPPPLPRPPTRPATRGAHPADSVDETAETGALPDLPERVETPDPIDLGPIDLDFDDLEPLDADDSADDPILGPVRRALPSDTPTLMPAAETTPSPAVRPPTLDLDAEDLPWGDPDAPDADDASADLPFHVSGTPPVDGDADLEALLDDDSFLFGDDEPALDTQVGQRGDTGTDPPAELDDPFAAYRAFDPGDAFDALPFDPPPGVRARAHSGALPRIGPKSDDLLVSDHAGKDRADSVDGELEFVGGMDYDPMLDSRPPLGELAPLPGRAVPLGGDAAADPAPPDRARGLDDERNRDRRSDVLPTLHPSATRYELDRELARGGMGRVVEARDLNIDRVVAMKLLIKGRDEQLGMQLRFTEEAQITGQLQHPNIVPVYDLGTQKDGQLYFTMKLVKGRTLRDVLRDLRRGVPETEKAFTRTRLLQSFQQVCMGIAYAHDHHVVHRDLKPSNIMFGDFGETLVMDWGLAKILPRRVVDADGRVQSHRAGMSRWATRHGEVIGTPGYMPPELALGNLDEVDERSDIYSLGAILYEILTLRPPYTGRDARAIIRKMLRERVVPPRKRAPARNIAPELEEIAMRCLAKDIEQRYPTVLELHGALQAFLDGALEQERQKREARRHIAEARAHVDAYHTHHRAAERLLGEVEAHRLRLAPWAGAEPRRALWDAQQRLDTVRRERLEAFTRATGSYRQALVCDPDDADAREALCQLYWDGFLLAEHEGDEASMVQYETVLRGVDTGPYANLLRGDGRLHVETDPPGARAVLFRFDEIDKVLTPQSARDLGRTPLSLDPLAMGNYLLVLRAPGLRETQVPVMIERLGEVRVDVRLRTDTTLGAGFVYIPGGPKIIGGDPDASWGLPRQTVDVTDFCLARLPVSARQYLDFLNALVETDVREARRRSPRLFAEGGALFLFEGGRFRIPERDPNGIPWDPNWPVFGISFDDAQRYCRWRSEIDGVRYRLPTEIEWEVAARGADLRRFPWGDTWEPTYCKSAHARPGAPHLEPCGSFSTDRSPYGVMDLAGGVSDWTVTTATTGLDADHPDRICRGGSWNHLDLHARCASRHALAPASVSVSVGFRLARDP